MPIKACAAECFATFCLVLVSAGALVVDAGYGGHLGHVGCTLAVGLVVIAMIAAVGGVSGAHLNPAVSIGFWAAGRIPLGRMVAYIAAQAVGSIAAAALLRATLGVHGHLGATVAHVEPHIAFALELALAAVLMYVVLAVATGAELQGLTAAVAVGSAVAMNTLWAGPLTGAAMNPARTLGPALLGDTASSLWLYCTAPVIGAALAVILHRLTHTDPATAASPDDAAPLPD